MIDLLTTAYPWIKAGHILAVISWMAGLFYLPRLFVHNAERGSEGHDALLTMMQGKLLRVIMRPAMIATWLFGLALVSIPGVVDWGAVWPWVKAVCVVAMTGFHMWCAACQKEFVAGANSRNGRTYRIMNEVPTLLLILIVVAVIVRPF